MIPAIMAERRKHPGLSEDGDWRDWLERQTGSRSLKALSPSQQRLVLAALRAGGAAGGAVASGRALASDPQSRLLRALWLSLYHLGEVRDQSERALAAFARRAGSQAEALQWLDVGEKVGAIENLKSWAKRIGLELPRDPLEARRAVIRLQWQRLGELGVVGQHPWALDVYASQVALGRRDALAQITDAPGLDRVIRALGVKLRPALTKTGGGVP